MRLGPAGTSGYDTRKFSVPTSLIMPDIPAPRRVAEPLPFTPPGGALARALRAIVTERRLPTRLETARERLLKSLGRRRKMIQRGSLRFRVRRLAADEHFIDAVLDGFYAPPGYEIAPADVVIDVGANIGAFAVLAGQAASAGRVLALEPAAENFALLEDNLRLNRLPNVKAIKAALAARSGTTTLYLADRSSGDHSTDPAMIERCRGTETVEGLTIAELLDRDALPACDLIKFNCEGAEVPIVLGLDEATAARLRRIVLGYHVDVRHEKRPQADRLVRRLVDLGYTIDDYTDIIDTHRGTVFARRG